MSNESGERAPDGTAWAHAIERAQLGVWDWDLVSDSCRYSDSWFAMLGYAPDELAQDSQTWLRLVHPEDRERAIRSGETHIFGEAGHIETELRLRHKDGHYVWVLDRGGIVARGAQGNPARVVGVQTDITRQKTVEADLAETARRFRLALEASRIGIWKFDIARRTSMWDARTRAIFGLVSNTGTQDPEIWQAALHPEDRARAEWAHAVERASEEPQMVRYRIVRPDGSVRHVETLSRLVAEFGTEGCLLGTARDVTDEAEADAALETEKERYRVTLRSIRDAVISTDTDNRVVFANLAARVLLGHLGADREGQNIADVLVRMPAAPTASGDGNAELRLLMNPSGGYKVIRCSVGPLRASVGGAAGTVYTLQDVTAEHRRQEELAYAAQHDPLTGLLNRSAFNEKLVACQSRTGPDAAVLYIDLDYFKALNDVAGHAAGDEALKTVAQHILAHVGPNAYVARLGGDEFAVLTSAHDASEIEELAQRLVTAIGGTRIDHRKGSHMLSASVGAALLGAAAIGPADALAVADDACYAAKSKGRNRWALLSGGGPQTSSGMTAARIVSDLLDAKHDGRLALFGQEIRDTQAPGRSTSRIEVLTRLTGRDGMPIPPSAFVPAAERFGVAASVDRLVFRTALTQHGGHMRGAGGATRGFNLSAQTLSVPLLWDYVAYTLEDAGVPPERVVFEITETAAFTNVEAAERFVSLARGAGCKISLDDFGAGLSSFSYLRKFRVDSIKIDGSFIQHLREDSIDCDIVAAIAGIAEGLGYAVVAEKVEHAEALAVLARLGVGMVQGFLMHRPEPLGAVVARVAGADPQAMAF